MELSQENKDLKKWSEQNVLIPFRKRNNKVVKNWQGRGIWASARKLQGGEKKDKSYYNNVYLYRFLSLNSPSLVVGMSSFLVVQRGHLSNGNFTSCFQEETRRIRVLFSKLLILFFFFSIVKLALWFFFLFYYFLFCIALLLF